MVRLLKTSEIYDAGYAIPLIGDGHIDRWQFRDEQLVTPASAVAFCEAPAGCNFKVARIEDVRESQRG